MGKDKSGKKERNEKSRKKQKTLKILDISELEQQAAVGQSNLKIQFSKNDDSSYRTVFFSPEQTNLNTAQNLTFEVGPFRKSTFHYNPKRPLLVLWKFSIIIREIDRNGAEIGAADAEVSLKPAKHGVYPWPVTGASGLFSKVRTSYNNMYTNDTEILQANNLDELNTLGSMESFLNPSDDDVAEQQSYGTTPLYNNTGYTAAVLNSVLGKPPNLNFPDTTANNTEVADKGYRWGYGRLPVMPFSKWSPRMKLLMQQNAGFDPREDLGSVIFPPKTRLYHQFTKTEPSRYLHEWYWPSYSDNTASKNTDITGGRNSYMSFIDDDNKKYIIKRGSVDVAAVYLMGYTKKLTQTSLYNNLPRFNSFFTARRVQETKLDSNRYPVHSVFVDQKNLCSSFTITFRRQAEMDRDPGQDHNFSSNAAYRPPTLDRIQVFEGLPEGGDMKTFNDMDITGLASNGLNLSLIKYAETTKFGGWISEKQTRGFWEFPNTQSSGEDVKNSGNVGKSNYFPFSTLSERIEKSLKYFSEGANKAELMLIRLEFTEPLETSWYMLVYSEYLCELKWSGGSGEPQFHIL